MRQTHHGIQRQYQVFFFGTVEHNDVGTDLFIGLGLVASHSRRVRAIHGALCNLCGSRIQPSVRILTIGDGTWATVLVPHGCHSDTPVSTALQIGRRRCCVELSCAYREEAAIGLCGRRVLDLAGATICTAPVGPSGNGHVEYLRNTISKARSGGTRKHAQRF